MYDRYVLGKWAAYEGLVHPDFDTAKHTLSRQDVMDYLGECRERHVKIRALEGYDFGNIAPSVYLLSFVDDVGRVIVCDGFYEPNFNYDLQPQRIFEIRMRYMGFMEFEDDIIADPAIFRKQVVAKRQTGVSVAQLFRELNLPMRAGMSDVGAGIAKVNAYLADKVGARHLLTGEASGPMLYVVDDLSWFENEITNYYWKKNPFGEQIDEPQEHNDHAMTGMKYMLSYLPEPSQIIVPADQLPPDWMYWQEMDRDDYMAAINNRYQ
jgi:hypothetical protein